MSRAEAAEEFPFSDVSLSRRLERAEATMNAACVTARAEQQPGSRAGWIDVDGAHAMFDVVGSPLTQSFGLGLFAVVTDESMRRLERFFSDHGAHVFHEVSPLADPSALQHLTARGYQPIELTSVLFRPIGPTIGLPSPGAGALRVRRTGTGEAELWTTTAARGWGDTPELAAFMLEFGQILARREGALSFLAEADGTAIAAGAMSITDGIALLAGASTVPEGRRRGAQLALLRSRLEYAVEQGCDLAMMCAQPGSGSQRNAERHGFRVAYTRIKWQRLRDPVDAA